SGTKRATTCRISGSPLGSVNSALVCPMRRLLPPALTTKPSRRRSTVEPSVIQTHPIRHPPKQPQSKRRVQSNDRDSPLCSFQSIARGAEQRTREREKSTSCLNCVQETHRIADCLDLLCFLVADLAAKLLFESHDQLHQIQAVRFQVVAEARLHRHVARLYAQLIDDNVADAFESLFFSHDNFSPLPFFCPRVSGLGNKLEWSYCMKRIFR